MEKDMQEVVVVQEDQQLGAADHQDFAVILAATVPVSVPVVEAQVVVMVELYSRVVVEYFVQAIRMDTTAAAVVQVVGVAVHILDMVVVGDMALVAAVGVVPLEVCTEQVD